MEAARAVEEALESSEESSSDDDSGDDSEDDDDNEDDHSSPTASAQEDAAASSTSSSGGDNVDVNTVSINSIEPRATPTATTGPQECPDTDTPIPVVPLTPEIQSFIEDKCSPTAQLGASPALEKAPPQLVLDEATASASFGVGFSPALRQMVTQAKRQLPSPPIAVDFSQHQQQQQRQRSISLKRSHDDDDHSALNAPKRNLSVGRGPKPDDDVIEYWNERNMLLFQQKKGRGRPLVRGSMRGGK